jgi:Inner membrane component of T3SS, cytoplasmic domain
MSWYIEHLHRDGSVLLRVPLLGTACHIGRSLDNDLVLDDAHCAARHARLELRADGTAELIDLGSINGIAWLKGPRTERLHIASDQPIRLGQSTIRVRSSQWPLPPEEALSTRRPWVWALLALSLVLAHTAWSIWVGDVNDKTPPYLYGLSGTLLGFAAWSTLYALMGRLISGVDRFFSHVLVACSGYLAAMACNTALDVLAFATGWLWPMQIAQYVFIAVVALTVRAHLRLADPRHWPVMRWGVLLVATGAMLVPVAQLWVSSHRLTRIQLLQHVEHPSLRLAAPVAVDALSQDALALKRKVDAARQDDDQGEEDEAGFDEE